MARHLAAEAGMCLIDVKALGAMTIRVEVKTDITQRSTMSNAKFRVFRSPSFLTFLSGIRTLSFPPFRLQLSRSLRQPVRPRPRGNEWLLSSAAPRRRSEASGRSRPGGVPTLPSTLASWLRKLPFSPGQLLGSAGWRRLDTPSQPLPRRESRPPAHLRPCRVVGGQPSRSWP